MRGDKWNLDVGIEITSSVYASFVLPLESEKKRHHITDIWVKQMKI